ncbi:MAG TPA: cytochrome C [Gallionellaceae bacterium]|nr:cytochrome C [Gallionellaceae bacterium]
MLLLVLAMYIDHASGNASADVGEAIYLQGVLGTGESLEAVRAAGARVSGKDAACVNCHRHSGLGSKEGYISIPPITGRYLFHPRAANTEDDYLPYVETMRAERDPYTDATLASAIRDGHNSEGKPLTYLMPHYALSDVDMASLIGYLKRLDQRKLHGVTDTVLHFATIITPDADPVKARGMLDVLQQYFTDKNSFPIGPTPRLRSSRKMMYMVNRLWQLHIWQLTGEPATWQAQLDRHFAQEPVLAVVSGMGGKNWAPVHAFCEERAVPCLFPNVEAPPAGADSDFYSLYLSRGVELEAGLIANSILKPGSGKVTKVVQQIYRAGDSGEAGAQALAAALVGHGIRVRRHILAAGKPGSGLAHALHQAATADALVLWLRPADIAALGKAPVSPHIVYMSGLMGGLERSPLPSSWRGRTHLAYSFALPEERRVNVDYAFGWFRIRHIPVVAEQVQADTYLACGLLAETLKHMVDTFVPDYLVERIEDMIDRRIITGYYPHLTLAPGQRFASKGGYIVHFSEPQGTHLIADNDWNVP